MRTRKINAELPEAEKQRLQQLRASEDQRPLHFRVLALRDRGWPLRAIGDAIGVSRMSIQVWETDSRKKPEHIAAAKTLKNVPTLPLDVRGSGVSAKKMKIDVPPHDRKRLRELAAQAKTVRRWSAPDAPERVASAELDKLVLKYVRERGVAPMTVARHAGVTRRAIMARLERLDEREVMSA